MQCRSGYTCRDDSSIPAQIQINSATDVARLLLDRGATPGIFLAATLGDLSLVIEFNPNSVADHIVNNGGSFADIGFQGKDGSISSTGHPTINASLV